MTNSVEMQTMQNILSYANLILSNLIIQKLRKFYAANSSFEQIESKIAFIQFNRTEHL